MAMMSTAELPFVIKICGITNSNDAQVAIDAGANALGFNFYRNSPRYITPVRARRIVEAVPGEFLRIGVFVNTSEQELLNVAEQVQLDALQLHGDNCPIPVTSRYRIWRSIGPEALRDESDAQVEAYVVDTPTPAFGGSGKTFDWELARGNRCRIILAGGLHAGNVKKAVETAHPWGVDACSRLESQPGEKDWQKVREFVRAARTANLDIGKVV
jgi:phosphoribosylanthranilate isomerase